MSRVILVTGSNTGIGLELVRLLAEKPENHTVYLAARNEASGRKALFELEESGLKNIKFVQLDITDTSSVEAAVKTVKEAEGRLDVLVNNAGVANMDEDQKAPTVSMKTLRDVFEPNFFGTVQTTQAFLPLLREARPVGVILDVTTDMASNSYMTTIDFLHFTAYNTSKAAANSYVIALAHELRDEPIKVNTVTPGFTSTKLNFFGQGGKTAREGAESLLPFALLDKDGPSGKFFGPDGKEFPW